MTKVDPLGGFRIDDAMRDKVVSTLWVNISWRPQGEVAEGLLFVSCGVLTDFKNGFTPSLVRLPVERLEKGRLHHLFLLRSSSFTSRTWGCALTLSWHQLPSKPRHPTT